jgi:hypothetical protein
MRYAKWLAVVVGVVACIAIYIEHVDRERSRERETAISPEEVRVEGLSLGNLAKARIHNLSSTHTINLIVFRFTVDDCVEQECVTIAQGNAIWPGPIPPGQARDVSMVHGVGPYQAKGKARLTHKVTRILGD